MARKNQFRAVGNAVCLQTGAGAVDRFRLHVKGVDAAFPARKLAQPQRVVAVAHRRINGNTAGLQRLHNDLLGPMARAFEIHCHTFTS